MGKVFVISPMVDPHFTETESIVKRIFSIFHLIDFTLIYHTTTNFVKVLTHLPNCFKGRQIVWPVLSLDPSKLVE